MFNAIVELFLTEYFVTMASAGKFVEDRKDLFIRMSQAFLIENEQAEKLFALCDNDEVREIVTEQDYLRYQRMRRYSELTGGVFTVNCDLEEIIRVKGNALSSASRQKLSCNPLTSRNAEYASLITAANCGVTIAIKILGFLQCEGIFLDKNLQEGLKNFSKAANWNDCAGVLALLRYSDENKRYNMSRLKTITEGTPFESLFASAVKIYGNVQTFDVPEVKVLNRAFSSAILNRDAYNPVYARILYGDVLSLKDKEKAMFSSDTGKLSLLGDLPLKLSANRITGVDVSRLSDCALNRPAERRKIISALNNADLRLYGQYRPLCLVSDTPYVLDMYLRAICGKNEHVHYEQINVAELTAYDLEPTANNVFVRNVHEDKDNRFLLVFEGNVPDKTMDFVKNFLLGSRRAKFHLNSPNVTLNLDAVLPVCFCDKRNARLLEDVTDVVRLADVSRGEMQNAVEDITRGKSSFYGVDIALQGTACELFADCSVDKVDRLIDAVARDRRKEGKTVVISRETVTEYDFNFNNKRIGFSA